MKRRPTKQLRVYIRVYMNKPRSESENPVTLRGEQRWVVARDGYGWIEAHRFRAPEQVIIPNSTEGIAYVPSRETLLAFLNTKITPAGILSLANRFGLLQLVCPHRHLADGSVKKGAESIGQWLEELHGLQKVAEAQKIAESANDREIRLFARENEWLLGENARNSLLQSMIEIVNHHLSPRLISYPGKCFVDGCALIDRPRVSYTDPRNALVLGNRKGLDFVQQKIFPGVGLSAFLWLEMAEMLCLNRDFRRCEACGEWMDITDRIRKGRKTIHDRCSKAARQRRYRDRLKAADH